MNAYAPLSAVAPDDQSSRPDHRNGAPEMSFRNALTSEEAERAWFRDLLWKAFPEAISENELAQIAAEVLTTERRPVTARAVKNWLRCDNSPHFRYVIRVIGLAGAESVFQVLDPEAVR